MSNELRPSMSELAPTSDAARNANLAAILESPSYQLAEFDVDFLQRKENRPLRMQLELLKTETLLREHHIDATVVVFGGTQIMPREQAEADSCEARSNAKKSPNDPKARPRTPRAERIMAKSHFYDEAREFGRIVSTARQIDGRPHLYIMTGGGPGVMEAANRGAFEAGAKSIGLNIDLPHEQEPNPYITPDLCFQFHYFAMRKFHFVLRAAALVVFPGGYGTLDELFDTLCLRQTRRMQANPGHPLQPQILGLDHQLPKTGRRRRDRRRRPETDHLRRNPARSLVDHRQIPRRQVISTCDERRERTTRGLVTGGAIRVGAAIVRELAARGYRVAIHANTSLDRANELATELNNAGHTAAAFGADLRNEDATRAMIDRVRRHFGRLDLVVNSAATWSPTPLAKSWPTTSAASSKSTRSAPSSAANTLASSWPSKTGGAIVNIGDWAVDRPYRDYAPTSSPKPRSRRSRACSPSSSLPESA